ncbi:uncharacterized protein LOC105844115 isoform X2 [Hydra vulgaris]|uniref:uncharacterized protein LOC105844115 isoform X2 n=1 Tax=Hydra vulgaris TaxID=6087 RepID=UPI0032EA46B4
MMLWLKKTTVILLIHLSQVKASFPSECKDLVLYSTLGTFGGCLFISSFILFIVIRRKKRNFKENLEHVKGKRNKLFEEDFICKVRERHDTKFIPPCNESILPFPDILQLQKSFSMPNLTKNSSLVENYKKNDGKFINSACSSEILNCLHIKQFRSFGAQTDYNLVPTEKVIVEKKSADCVGLDFGTAGIYIKNVDADEVFFKQGCLVAVTSSKFQTEVVQNENFFSFDGCLNSPEYSKLHKKTECLSVHQDIPVTLDCLYDKQDKLINSYPLEELSNKSDFSAALQGMLIESDSNSQKEGSFIKTFFSRDEPFNRLVFEESQLKSDIRCNFVDENSSKNVYNKTFNKRPYQSCHKRASSNESLQINKIKICKPLGIERFNRTQSAENIPLNINSQLKRSFSHDNQTYEQPCYGYTQKKFQYLYENHLNQRFNDGEYNDLLDQKRNSGDYLNLYASNNTRKENMMVKRGYNYDYIVPITNCVPAINNLYNTRCQKNRSTVINFNKLNVESMFLSSLPSQSNTFFLKKDSGRVPYSTKNPPSYESTQNNMTKKDHGIIDYIKYNEARYSCSHLKEPPLYSDYIQVINMVSNTNVNQSKNKSTPLPYDVNIETKCNDKLLDVKDGSISKRSYPKRTHSMPAVRHIDERSRIAKTFLIDEDVKTPKKVQNKLIKSAYCNRRKSIDSGTLKKLAVELQNNPELGCEYPMISQLLCESQFTAIERRGKNLYRNKSTEAIITRSYDSTVEFL